MDFYDIDFNSEYTVFYVLALNNTYVRKDRVVCYCCKHHCCVSKKQSKKRHCSTCKHKRMTYKGEQIESWRNLKFTNNSWHFKSYTGMSEEEYYTMRVAMNGETAL